MHNYRPNKNLPLEFRLPLLYPPSDYLVSHVSRRFLSQFSTDLHEILQGLFSSQAATTMKFSLENIVSVAKKVRPSCNVMQFRAKNKL